MELAPMTQRLGNVERNLAIDTVFMCKERSFRDIEIRNEKRGIVVGVRQLRVTAKTLGSGSKLHRLTKPQLTFLKCAPAERVQLFCRLFCPHYISPYSLLYGV